MCVYTAVPTVWEGGLPAPALGTVPAGCGGAQDTRAARLRAH